MEVKLKPGFRHWVRGRVHVKRILKPVTYVLA
ncbi:unnamed protein product, partial [marine sediment metagenome]